MAENTHFSSLTRTTEGCAHHFRAPLSAAHCGSCPDLPRCTAGWQQEHQEHVRRGQVAPAAGAAGASPCIQSLVHSSFAAAVSESGRALLRLGCLVRPAAKESCGRLSPLRSSGVLDCLLQPHAVLCTPPAGAASPDRWQESLLAKSGLSSCGGKAASRKDSTGWTAQGRDALHTARDVPCSCCSPAGRQRDYFQGKHRLHRQYSQARARQPTLTLPHGLLSFLRRAAHQTPLAGFKQVSCTACSFAAHVILTTRVACSSRSMNVSENTMASYPVGPLHAKRAVMVSIEQCPPVPWRHPCSICSAVLASPEG